MQQITPFLWFDGQAEEAMNFYVGIFPNSKVVEVSRYPIDAPGAKAGQVMMCVFELDGRPFTALNGGPMFKFTEAISFTVNCENQAEVDRYWDALVAGGGEHSQCGWLKDRYGLSWQITPLQIRDTVAGPDPEGAKRAMQAMMQMTKLDIAELERAYRGG